MKYALTTKCSKKYLDLADEIIVPYKEKERLLDYQEQYAEKPVTVQCWTQYNNMIDTKWLKGVATQYPKGFSVGVTSMTDLKNILAEGLPAYFLRTINNFAALAALQEMGAAYVYLDQPLFSSLDKVQRFDINVRWVPNLVDASPGYLQRMAHGTWIRPEDIKLYEEMFPNSICEFIGAETAQAEQALYRIYKSGEWKQDIEFIMPEFKDQGIANWLIDDQVGKQRLTCRQRCEEYPNGAGCHSCDLGLQLAKKDLLQKFADELPTNNT